MNKLIAYAIAKKWNSNTETQSDPKPGIPKEVFCYETHPELIRQHMEKQRREVKATLRDRIKAKCAYIAGLLNK